MAGFDFNTPNMMPFPGSGNPFDMGLLAQLAANNPGLIAQVAAAHGIAPPTAQNPVNGIDFNQSPLGAFLTPNMANPSMLGGPQPGTDTAPAGPTQAANAANPWAAMQGFKGPQVSPPIFSGGVGGAQKAPDASLAGAANGSQQLNQLIAQLIAGAQPQNAGVRPVGTLGSYIGGR
jgi:hypothetical protein